MSQLNKLPQNQLISGANFGSKVPHGSGFLSSIKPSFFHCLMYACHFFDKRFELKIHAAKNVIRTSIFIETFGEFDKPMKKKHRVSKSKRCLTRSHKIPSLLSSLVLWNVSFFRLKKRHTSPSPWGWRCYANLWLPIIVWAPNLREIDSDSWN